MGRVVTPTDDLGPAAWLVEAGMSFDGTVASLLAAGYPACLRVFHRPDQGIASAGPRTWSDVAEIRGTVLHPEAQWHAISQWSSDFDINGEVTTLAPQAGSLDRHTLPVLVRHLTAHTTTPQTCHMALWHGYGTSPRSWDQFPVFHLPLRGYWLFPPAPVDTVVEHSVELEVAGVAEQAATSAGVPGLTSVGPVEQPVDSLRWARAAREAGDLRSPSWWWPSDRAWVVHTEVDYDSTLIATSINLMNALLADPDIECLRLRPTDSLYASADTINDHFDPGTLRLNRSEQPPPGSG